jgi:hypothetical protein
MSDFQEARRQFLKATGLAAGAMVLSPGEKALRISPHAIPALQKQRRMMT